MTLLTFLQAAATGAALGKGLATISAAIVVIGAALGIGKIGKAAMEAIARQPQAANDIRMSMIIVGALVEGVSLFAVIVCLLVAL